MSPKSDTIAAILKLNPTAEPEFLSEFPNIELDAYLRRLQCIPKRKTIVEVAPSAGAPLVAAIAPQAQR